MVRVFPVVRALHELMVLLCEAIEYPVGLRLRRELRDALRRCTSDAHLPPESLEMFDVAPERQQVGELLRRASASVRASAGSVVHEYERADFAGADLRGADLRGASLRSATLLGANLSRADLTMTDLLGADLRGARLFGANLRQSLFVMEPQVAAAEGDAETLLPERIRRPAHWPVRLGRKYVP